MWGQTVDSDMASSSMAGLRQAAHEETHVTVATSSEGQVLKHEIQPGHEDCSICGELYEADDFVVWGFSCVSPGEPGFSRRDIYEEGDDVTRGYCISFDSSPGSTLQEDAPTTEPAGKRCNMLGFADCDACFDVISPTGAAGANMDTMFEYAEEYGRLLEPQKKTETLLASFSPDISAHAARVAGFSGSNRHSRNEDGFNAVSNDRGSSLVRLKKPAEANRWQFNGDFVEDVGLNAGDIMNSVGGGSKSKQLLAEKNRRRGGTTMGTRWGDYAECDEDDIPDVWKDCDQHHAHQAAAQWGDYVDDDSNDIHDPWQGAGTQLWDRFAFGL